MSITETRPSASGAAQDDNPNTLDGSSATATWSQRADFHFVDLLLPAATALWIASVRVVNPNAMNAYGLLAALPVMFFVAVALTVVSIAITVTRPRVSRNRLVLHLVALVMVLHGTVPMAIGAPNYPWVYKHIGVVDAINLHGQLHASIDIYQSWPGFFALAAWFARIAGAPNPLGYAGWAPVFFNLLLCLELSFAAKRLAIGARTRWLALFLFVIGNWVGQDYFAPQAMAFVLSLAVFALVLRWMQVDRPVALLRVARRLAARVAVPAARSAPEVELDVPADSRPPTAALVGLLAIFAVIVVMHQLSPYMVIVGVGLLAVLGLVRPRWVVVAMVALAGGYLLIHASYLEHTQDLFGSLFDPFRNIKGNGIGAATTQFGRRLTALGAPALVAAMWGLAFIGLVRRIRAGRPVAVLAVLAASPILMAAGQSYGGEMVFRIYLFSLPWVALLAACALEPRVGRWSRWKGTTALTIGVTLAVGVVLFMSAFFGAEELYRVRPGEVRASQFFYEHAQPHSVLVLGAADFPSRVAANYDDFVSTDATPNLLATDYGSPRHILSKGLPAVSSFVAESAKYVPGGAYLVLTSDQAVMAEVLRQAPPGALQRLDAALSHSPEWQLFYRNSDAVIYRFLGARPSGSAPPPVRPAARTAVPTVTNRSSDPWALGIGIAGLGLMAMAMKRRHHHSVHLLARNHQEKVMEVPQPLSNGAGALATSPDTRVLERGAANDHHVGPPAAQSINGAQPPGPMPAPSSRQDAATHDDIATHFDDPSPSVRLSALEGIEISPSSVAFLRDRLDDDMAVDVRVGIVRALARAPETDQRDALAVALADVSPAVRACAAESLATSVPVEPQLLAGACDDTELVVRRAAYRRLATTDAVTLWEAVRRSAHREELQVAIGAGHTDLLAAVSREAMRSGAPADRVFGIWLASDVGTASCRAAVTAAAHDPDAAVRRAVVFHIGAGTEAISMLVDASQDPDASVRLVAVQRLAETEHTDALSALVEGIDDSDPVVRGICVEALVAHASTGLARLVAAALTTENSTVIGEILLRMGPPGQAALGTRTAHDTQVAAEPTAAHRAPHDDPHPNA